MDYPMLSWYDLAFRLKPQESLFVINWKPEGPALQNIGGIDFVLLLSDLRYLFLQLFGAPTTSFNFGEQFKSIKALRRDLRLAFSSRILICSEQINCLDVLTFAKWNPERLLLSKKRIW